MNSTKKDGRSTGLEPATFGTTNQRSNQLSYDRHEAERYIIMIISSFLSIESSYFFVVL